jgi:hypothetical protein
MISRLFFALLLMLAAGSDTALPQQTTQTFTTPSFSSIVVAVRSSSAAAITVTTTDYFLCLDPSSNGITVSLPTNPATGQTYLVKDCTGHAGAHSITVTPAGGAHVDGNANYVLTIPYQVAGFTYTGSQWSLN